MNHVTFGLHQNAGYGGKFSNLNMSKSLELHDKIVRQRVENRHHLQLCNEIYLYQTSKRRHVHLEQPSESVMLEQPELADLKEGTLPSVFDMCKVGKLKMPQSQLYLQKRTKVNTSSGYLDHHLHERYCDKDHEHVVIQGSMKHDGKHMNVSTYAAAYTSSFGSFVADKVLRECVLCEPPVVLFQEPDDVFAVGEKHEAPDPAPEDSQCQKRRRHGIKGPPRGSDLDTGPSPPSSRYGKAPSWGDAIKRVAKSLPRVGNFVIHGKDPMCQDFHMLVPELRVKLVVLCRGTEKYRTPRKPC